MKKTIELIPKAAKWIFIFNGIVNSIFGVSQLVRVDTLASWWGILGILLVLVGPLMIIYGIVLFNPSNKFVPKVLVDDSGILIKEDVYKTERKIDWENIKEISYKSFELDFLLKDNVIQRVNLQTNAVISIEIKRAIRQFADSRNIRIIGG